MRYLYASVFGAVICLIGNSAFAACAPNVLGTSRTISIDSNKYRSFNGDERSLGLRNKEVILTFDDGPIAGKTERVLDTLKENCIKATFFAVGKMARAYPQLAKRIVRDGHTLAHHTYDHNRLPKYSRAKASSHIDNGIKLVEKAAYNASYFQARTPFFRFPYLSTNKATRDLIREKKLVAFGTNIDSLDWKKDSPDRIVNRVMRRLAKEKKGIILMHDIHNRTALMLPKLLARLKKGGYKIVHMVPYRGGAYASVDTTDNGVKIAALNASNAKAEAAIWQIRITDQIASSFIIAFDDVAPIDRQAHVPEKLSWQAQLAFGQTMKRSENPLSKKLRTEVIKPVKIIDKDAIKKWALRSAFTAL
ncbi:MAG: polysaccharide deacetylase family protein [Rhizobiales bacterium]|nr:polysaccharide deacetylase family protein [Hyphomicrobiales bacterium]